MVSPNFFNQNSLIGFWDISKKKKKKEAKKQQHFFHARLQYLTITRYGKVKIVNFFGLNWMASRQVGLVFYDFSIPIVYLNPEADTNCTGSFPLKASGWPICQVPWWKSKTNPPCPYSHWQSRSCPSSSRPLHPLHMLPLVMFIWNCLCDINKWHNMYIIIVRWILFNCRRD